MPPATDATLIAARYCSLHGIDLVPPDRTLATRRYCPKCDPGSALGFPAWCRRCDQPLVYVDEEWTHKRLHDAVQTPCTAPRR